MNPPATEAPPPTASRAELALLRRISAVHSFAWINATAYGLPLEALAKLVERGWADSKSERLYTRGAGSKKRVSFVRLTESGRAILGAAKPAA